MEKFGVQLAFEAVRDAKRKWDAARRQFDADMDFVMTRLLHEAAMNYMSVEQVAKATGLTPKRVRMAMRRANLDPKKSKRLLAAHAADALRDNSALLGIEPHQMDLMSPLAYLPMGSELRQQILETEKVSRNNDGCPVMFSGEVQHIRTSDCDLARPCPDDVDGPTRATIVQFTGLLSAYYREHTGRAVNEDMVFACIVFGVDPASWGHDEAGVRELRAMIAYHKEAGTYDGAIEQLAEDRA